MQDFRKLVVWKRAHSLVIRIYALTRLFPANERYGLTTQIRRCASSIPTNIAEGCGRQSSRELIRFVEIALGSASELDYQLLLAHDLGFITPSDYAIDSKAITDIKRMLSGLRTGIMKRVTTKT